MAAHVAAARRSSAPQRNDRRAAAAHANQGLDVGGHARERIDAALPSVIPVVAGDEVGADVADGDCALDPLDEAPVGWLPGGFPNGFSGKPGG